MYDFLFFFFLFIRSATDFRLNTFTEKDFIKEHNVMNQEGFTVRSNKNIFYSPLLNHTSFSVVFPSIMGGHKEFFIRDDRYGSYCFDTGQRLHFIFFQFCKSKRSRTIFVTVYEYSQERNYDFIKILSYHSHLSKIFLGKNSCI